MRVRTWIVFAWCLLGCTFALSGQSTQRPKQDLSSQPPTNEVDSLKSQLRKAEARAATAETHAATAESHAADAAKSATKAAVSASDAQTSATNAQQSAKSAQTKADDADTKVTILKQQGQVNREDLDRLWVLLAAVLVFFMQAGFKALEVGMSRPQHDAGVGVMNLMNWVILCLVFYVVGYGWMFGYSDHFFIWSQYFIPGDTVVLHVNDHGVRLGLEFFLFQLAFAATTATIIDGAIAERTALLPYCILTVLVAAVVYPLFGHWAWNDTGWLKTGWEWDHITYAFHDFAGSTVVHSVGAWAALVGIRFIGPRRMIHTEPNRFRPYGLGYSVLGAMLLWFGWWGFNGGSTLQADPSTALIILNTNLAGAAAGVAAYLHALKYGEPELVRYKIIGGTLGGLVAITASCDAARPTYAIAIGAIAGIVHNIALERLRNIRMDDVAGAVAVHGPCGVAGTLCAAPAVAWKTWNLWNSNLKNVPLPVVAVIKIGIFQLGVQVLGIVLAYLSIRLACTLIFWAMDRKIGFRVPLKEETPEEVLEERPAYSGPLWVSQKRWVAWSRFRPLREILDMGILPSALLDKGQFQIIRDDDTPASTTDIELASSERPFFLCYRSKDDQEAQLIHERLRNRFGEDLVYMDVYAGIPAGEEYWPHFDAALRRARVLLIVIGEGWAKDLRPQAPDDYVFREVNYAFSAEAQKRKMQIVPLLIKGASLKEEDLPPNLRALPRKTGIKIQPNDKDKCWTELTERLRASLPKTSDIDRPSFPDLLFGIKPFYFSEIQKQLAARQQTAATNGTDAAVAQSV